MDKDKIIARADALASLEGNEGWAIVEGHIKAAIETCKDYVFDSKKTKNWNDYLLYKSKYNAFTNLLFLIDRWKEQGRKTREAMEDNKNGQS